MKRLSVNDFERICKVNSADNAKEIAFDVGNDKSVTVIVKRVLSFKNRIMFVSEVVDNCFDDNGEFIPAVKDIAFKVAILKYFTNLTLPENPSKTYNLIIHSDIYSRIESVIDENEYYELCNEVDGAINHRKENAIATQKVELMKISNTMNAMTEQYSKLFDGVDIQDFMEKVSAFNNNVTELGANTATLSVVGDKSGL